jgi:hypothetical protein
MATETAFGRALEATTGYRIAGDTLELLANEKVLARLAVVYPR